MRLPSMVLAAILFATSASFGGPALAEVDPYPYCGLLQPPQDTGAPAPSPAASPAHSASPAAAPGASPASNHSRPGASSSLSALPKAGAKKGTPKRAVPTISDLVRKHVAAREIVDQILSAAQPATPAQLESMYDDIYTQIIETYIEPIQLRDSGFSAYKSKYKGKIKTWSQASAAIADMVKAVNNRWTWYIDPVQSLTNHLKSSPTDADFGIALALRADGTDMVEFINPGSTAQLAGLREGDLIVSVNGKALKGLSKDEAEKLFQKKEGDTLHVVSLQDGLRVEADYILHKPAPDAESPRAERIDKNIAYIKLPTFMMDQESFARLMGSLVQMDLTVPGGLQGIVLDLRYNGGGRVQLAKSLLRLLEDKGVVLHETTRDGVELVDETTRIMPVPAIMQSEMSPDKLAVLNHLKKLPLVVDINGSSASASEIVTGALQEARPNTTIVGERSFGKFVEMSVRTLPTCGTLAVMSAMYTTPKGEWLHGQGIVPDVVVHQPRNSHEDLQLAASVKILRAKTATSGANVAAFDTDSKILGAKVERPLDPPDSNWNKFWADNASEIIKYALTALLVLVLFVYIWFTRRAVGAEPKEK